MRFLLLLLSLVLQFNISGFVNHNPQENHAIKTLTSETLDCGGRSYELFRYYDCDSGNYLSQDPIELAGNNPTLYGYVKDTNSWIDPFGLDLHHIIPNQIYRQYSTAFDKVGGYAQNISKTGIDKSNLINLNTPFHGNHPKYNDYEIL